ncbi:MULTISPECIES: alpha-L-rhamnosidase [Emticicia]|uniref:alpha-L-rhamnosidase n=1 Tax=Emticicia TaxID=312278 RepID=UPI0007D89BB4|nr:MULTISPECIES: alpha-L-rhamnosidase [Emticicia]
MKKTLFLIASFMLFIGQINAQFTLQKLQVNYQTTPIGTDLVKPQFSWQMHNATNKRGQGQTAYQIVVTDEQNHTVWDSKKVISGISHAIQYEGEALKPTTRYTWKLTVWDNFNALSSTKSWFETGFLNTKIDAWSGAEWIGGGDEDLNFYSHYLSVFKVQYDIQLAQNSSKGSFIFGANDSRLSNQYLNFMGVERKKDESYVEIELDISTLTNEANSTAKLNIYRAGYTKTDKAEEPLKSIAIPQSIINQANKNAKHTVFVECNFGVFEFYIDGTDEAHKIADKSMTPTSRFAPRGLNLNPVGVGNNFISFPMLADIGFRTKANQTAFFTDIQVKNFRYPSNTLYHLEKAPLVSGEALITLNPSKNATPMLRSVFKTDAKAIKKARLYVTARGIYEVFINGNRVSNEYFNPGLTQYNKNHMYQTFDVTSNLKNGQANAIGAWLSEGWWSGNITYSGESWNWFGDRQSLLAKLVVTYADGSEQIVTTNNKDWKLFTDGPIRVGSFFQGEVYDATKEEAIKGWTTTNYNDKAWKSAVEVPLEGTGIVGDVKYSGRYAASLPYNDFKLVGQMGENIKIVKTLSAQKVEEVRQKVFVYDMGQNMVGFPQILIKNGKKGQIINLRYAEITYPNLPDYKGNEGMIMLENIRAALAQDQYILKGGDEIIQPRFTFHGYRYLEITGVEKAIPATDVKGLVISSISEISSKYETSNPLVNRFWENITWSLRGNFVSIPTDCPQRNERMGWSGDISVFARSSTYLTDANLFLRRHLLGMRDIQPESGRFTDVAPVGGGFGGTLWGSAGVVVAWETYRQYGDVQMLAEHYGAMKKYMAFLETKIDKTTGILNEGPLGDWLSPEGNKNDNTLFWMAYFAYDLELMSKMAEALGNTDDAKSFLKRSEEIKRIFNETYVDKSSHRTVKSGMKTGFMAAPNEADTRGSSDKGVLIDTQASYAVPLALGVFDAQNKPFVIKHLSETITRKNKDDGGIERPENSLMTGFIGTASMSEALSANGRDDLAYQLLTNKQYPSWLYSVVNGATTIWERLNSYTVENGFGGNNSMNSFNHYSFGAVAAWMYNYSLGIQRHPQKTGFKEFILKPTPDPTGQMTSAKGYYDSIYGRIESEWNSEGGKTTYKFTVPPNTSAALYLPANKQITESGKKVKIEKTEGDKVVISLSSGSYVFEVK